MKFKFLTIPTLSPDLSEKELNDFCSQHRVISIDKQLVVNTQNSFWTFCITWQEAEAPLSSSKSKKSPTVDYKEILTGADFTDYLELRNFRKEQAELAAVPAYALFTNQQLADMVQKQVSSKAALQKINGVGKARIEKYGDLFLQKLSELWGDSLNKHSDEKNPN